MKANELMIGDWVICHHPSMPENYVQITAGWLNTMERIEHGLVKEDSCLYRIFAPIPLTLEILEKNGFEPRDSDEEFEVLLNYGKWCYINEDGFEVIGDGGEIKFVHELQHCLKLVHIDKDIIL